MTPRFVLQGMDAKQPIILSLKVDEDGDIEIVAGEKALGWFDQTEGTFNLYKYRNGVLESLGFVADYRHPSLGTVRVES